MRTNTRAQRAENQRILRASNVCHLCGHPGADAVDHVIPLARGGADHITNKASAHHDVPCPTCGIKCNRVKGDKLVAPVIRRSGSLTR
jgi:5-methylcytosine-specific restriction endonuclease McrA